jgi:hypothetical protein
MSDESTAWHLGCSEFPNDNPRLHDGAIWVCFSPCGPLRPVVRPRSGIRPSTIPSPLPRVAEFPPPLVADTPHPTNADEATITEVTRAPDPGDGDEPSSVEGCSLSAGPRTDEQISEGRISELRETAAENAGASDDGTVASLAPPIVDVECAPSQPHNAAPVLDSHVADERKTILPPPSEDLAPRTLTLATIHVSGRSADGPTLVIESVLPPADAVGDAPTGTGVDEARPPQDPFAAFAGALVDVALAAGATRAAALLPSLLDGTARDFSGFSDAVRASLVSSGLVSDENGAIRPSDAFASTSNAWRMVLRGQSDDFSACGATTLDGWAGEILKAFDVGRDGKTDVRRELRKRGVAAFGMILAA